MFSDVCATWRTIATDSMPHIWATIHIDLVESPPHWAAAVRRYIQRSGQAPLRILVTCYEDLDDRWADPNVKTIEWCERTWTLLCAQSYRWKSLVVHFEPSKRLVWPAQFPVLEDLEIAQEDEELPPFFIFQDAPVSTLRLDFAYQSWLPLLVPSSWSLRRLFLESGLRGCEQRGGALEHYIDYIASCSPHLQHLDMQASYVFHQTVHRTHDRLLPALTSLHADSSTCEMLRYIIAPNLTSASLGYSIYMRDEIHPLGASYVRSFASLVEKSRLRTSLQSLEFVLFRWSNDTTAQSVIECLHLLPALTRLTLEGLYETYPWYVVAALRRDPGADRIASLELLPQLKALTVDTDAESVHGDFEGELRDMLRSRTKSCTHEGRELARLEQFSTNLKGNWDLRTLY